MEFLHTGISFIEPYIQQYGLYAIFVIIYLESLGAPLPGESALVASSLLAIRGDLAIADLFFAVWTAAVLGDSTGYAIGHFGGRPLLRRYGRLVKLTPERLDQLEELFPAARTHHRFWRTFCRCAPAVEWPRRGVRWDALA